MFHHRLQSQTKLGESTSTMFSWKYNGTANNLLWYRQYPGLKTQHIVPIVKSSDFVNALHHIQTSIKLDEEKEQAVAVLDTFYWGGPRWGQCLIRGAHKKTETNYI